MQKKQDKLDKALKLKLLFVLLMSNISMYMFMSSSPDQFELKNEPDLFREGYSELKIQGNLLTSFEENKPISILTRDKRVLVKYALLLKSVNSSSSDLNFGNNEDNQFIVYIPDTEITKLLNQKKLLLLPFGKTYGAPLKLRRSYEISI